MGWNSYNTWNCQPTEEKIKKSANGLIELGFNKVGYNFVTIDCGWNLRKRDANGALQWNTTRFPSGGKALGDFLHDLGLGFGLYSGPGTCNAAMMICLRVLDSSSPESQSPARFQRMAEELEAVDRGIRYYVCQWGIGTDVGEWAAKIGNTWRISNDIYGKWRSIWRITNQVVPYFRHTTTGAYADMDMLIVGLNSLSEEEERFHFGMWAINKSPLIMGAALDPSRLKNTSMEIMLNKEIIAINQDSLAKQAQLVRRDTEGEWDIWMGELSESRHVLGIANWRNDSRTVSVDLKSLGIASATARDVWAAKDAGTVSGSQTLHLAGHELRIWVLSNVVAAIAPKAGEYYSAAKATLSGSARVVKCAAGPCLPTAYKVGNILNAGSGVTFANVSAETAGKKLLSVDFINYDYAFTTSWGLGDNIRNMTVAVNGNQAKRWAFPLSGGDWQESLGLHIEVDGFVEGSGNTVEFRGFRNGTAPDLVGFAVLE
ncbi:hypothetical protein HRS9122_10240 [Pyrenophora teres f. teres]|nr:hypothetical protein HRS9122_10240 [Pyrenophora teres f. teres]